MTRRLNEHAEKGTPISGQPPGVTSPPATSDTVLLFVRDSDQWERDRRHTVEQLVRCGFHPTDRMCVSVAIDEAANFALELISRGDSRTAAIAACSVSARTFRVRIRFVPGSIRARRWIVAEFLDRKRWVLASACMTGFRLNPDRTEIEMWRDNSTADHPRLLVRGTRGGRARSRG